MTTVNPAVNIKPRLRVLPSANHNIYIIKSQARDLLVLTRSDVLLGYANMAYPIRTTMNIACPGFRLIP